MRFAAVSTLLLAVLMAAPAARLTASQPGPTPASGGAAGDSPTPEQWRADLKFLVETLPAKHVKPFARVSKSECLAAAAALDSSIPAMSADERAVGLMRLVAMLGDAHTVAYAATMPPGFRSYPIRLYWFADGLRVAAAVKGQEALLGGRLVRVGATPVEDAVKAVATTFVSENEALLKTGAAQALTSVETLHGLRLVDDVSAARFVLERANETGALEQHETVIAPVPGVPGAQWVRWPETTGAPVPLSRSRPQASYWSQRDTATGLFYIQYNRCQNAPDLSVADFAKTVLAGIDEQPPRAVVVDLRYNGGGSSSLLQPLIEGLAKRPAVNARDRLFVLIGRQTFSSALMNAVQFRQQTKVTLMGEPTGGKPNHFGETKTFSLPHSKMEIQYSTKYFQQQKKDEEALAPDVRVDVRGEDYAAGRDPVMAEAARRAAQP